MEIVEDRVFYHIYRKVSWNPYSMWELGHTYFIGKERNPFIKYYDLTDCVYNQNDNQSLISAIRHYQIYVREQIFEEVRKEFFPNMPSRFKGLWVIEEDIKTLNYWWKVFGESGTIIKLILNGKIHRGNEQYLQLTGREADFIRQQAFKYWSGSKGLNPNEVVFEGFAKVYEIVNPQKIFKGGV
ncbi:DUF2441 domain-containing protein [Metabacillus fastidiosus]|uniref:DUF2441 domain-containing protein n=1 Tax=Metabacillus fastidiosus TaxID=1458 RepID=A0ABU6P1L4_9BACI|nr:DUF2441 domain-containing protein [Metabacillus fastidiosus]